jgi:two-component system NarL family response regulator
MSVPQHIIRILIAEDHLVTRMGLSAIFSAEDDLQVVAEAANGAQAVELFRQHQPDVTLMDMRMPRVSGLAAIQQIRAEFPQARIIVLTTYETDADIRLALEAGAIGYLLKDASQEKLLAAVHSVARGKSWLMPEVHRRLVESQILCHLSARELEVLNLLARGLSNADIGAQLFIAENTVKNHVRSILEKLGVNDRTAAVTTALQRGFVRLDLP